MATNTYFQNYDYNNEQQLFDDLVVESIRMFGVDMKYVGRRLTSVDNIMNEDRLSIFDSVYDMEMYVKSVDSFQGEGDFLSKFGLQIRDQAVFAVAMRTFERYATRVNSALTRPLEGDLIYFPMNKKFFKIMFVEHESVFYQNGTLQVYDLKCELFEYSNERFETGVSLIDDAFNKYDTSDVLTLTDLNDMDSIAKNIYYEEEANTFIDFSEMDPFQERITFPEN